MKIWKHSCLVVEESSSGAKKKELVTFFCPKLQSPQSFALGRFLVLKHHGTILVPHKSPKRGSAFSLFHLLSKPKAKWVVRSILLIQTKNVKRKGGLMTHQKPFLFCSKSTEDQPSHLLSQRPFLGKKISCIEDAKRCPVAKKMKLFKAISKHFYHKQHVVFLSNESGQVAFLRLPEFQETNLPLNPLGHS